MPVCCWMYMGASWSAWSWILLFLGGEFLAERCRSLLTTWCQVRYPYLLPSSMLYGPQSSGAGHPHLLFSARWLVGDQGASSSLLVVLEQWRWHGGDLPRAERARCPKNLRWKDFTLSETGNTPDCLIGSRDTQRDPCNHIVCMYPSSFAMCSRLSHW